MAAWLSLLLALVIIFAAVELARPAPNLSLQPALAGHVAVPGKAVSLPWPSTGTAAMAVGGVGDVGSSGGGVSVPLASVTKMMTALVVLHDHPLGANAQGPSITVSSADVSDYQAELANGESVVAVQAGEVLSERQALQGLLLPSGNNIADLLAAWDAGSTSAFVAKMNATAASLGLRHTHYVDPSGISPGSVGTATDQVALAEVVMRLPAFASIVDEPQATLPVAGVVYNVNALVGQDGIVGVKTGSTPEVGSNLVFAADRTVDGRPVVLYGAVFGQKGPTPMATTFSDTQSLLSAMTADLRPMTVVTKGAEVARIKGAWGADVPALAEETVGFVGWPGMTVQTRVTAKRLGQVLSQGERVGTLEVTVGGQSTPVPLVASHASSGPSLSWRLRRL